MARSTQKKQATSPSTEVMAFRLNAELNRRLEQEARRRRLSKTEVVRAILSAYLKTGPESLATEARRQSLLAAASEGGSDLGAFLESTHDDRGWQ